jgi:MICOS complex subunit MIC12
VTLTLSLAYLTVLAHQRNREQQASLLRQQTYALTALYDPLPPTLPPTRAELAAIERANLVETVKDRWNAEIEGAVRWAQTRDWEEVREGLETSVARLWARAFSDAGEAAQSSGKAVEEQSRGVAEAAKGAYADTKARAAQSVGRAEEKARGEKAALEGKIEQKGSVLAAVADGVARGLQKGKEKLVGAAQVTEEKVEGVLGDKTPGLSPEEKAMMQRYQKTPVQSQTVDEALAARYVPVDQRDNTQLRAL